MRPVRLVLWVLGGVVGVVVAAFVVIVVVFAIAGPQSTAGYGELAWSPDGKKFAYAHWQERNCKSTIWVEDADSGKKVKLTDSGESPTWSPDGKHIAFVLFQSQYRSGIAVMDADGSNVKPLLLGSSFGCTWSRLVEPDWSPDGRLIAFSTSGGGYSLGISTIHPDGSGLRRLTTGDDYGPDWSPDSKRLVFTVTHHGPGADRYSGVVINADGTGRKTIQGSLYLDHAYAWSPDGKTILGYGLIPVNGGARRPFDIACQDCGNPVWSPDSTRVAALTDQGKIVITDVPTVSSAPHRYHYSVRLAPSTIVTSVGDQVEVYVSSPDLPQSSQALFTLCAVRLRGERCFRDTYQTPPSGRLTVTGGSETYFQWRINPDEAVDGDLRVSVRMDGDEVAHTTVTVRITQWPPAGTHPEGSSCDSSFPTVCIPSPPPDLDCDQIPYRNFQVRTPNPHYLDLDEDGVGCEREDFPSQEEYASRQRTGRGAAPGNGCRSGDGWFSAQVAWAMPAIDIGDYRDQNGDGLGCARVTNAEAAKRDWKSELGGAWIWKDNTS